MGLLSSIRTLRDYVFRRRRIEREMDKEFRAHLANRAADLQRQGLSGAEAERQARVEFGSYEKYKEECRETLGTRLLQEFSQDVRYGLRQLRRNPGFTIVAVLTLALGIGANTAIFSVVNTVLLHPLPYKNSNQLVMLWQRVPHFGANAFTTPDFLAWRRQTTIPIAAIVNEGFNLGAEDTSEHVPGSAISADFFPLLGVKPYLGRGFLPEEDQPDSRQVVILSYGLWQRVFGGDPAVLGKPLDLNGKPYTVIGIMPRNYWNVLQPDTQLWVPLGSIPAFSATRQNRSVHGLLVIGRLKAGMSLKQARAATTAIAANLGKGYPHTGARLGVDIVPLANAVVGSVRPALLILFAAVGLVLLIACSNVANLLLARATTRTRELAVRTALGAGRSRLLRQLLMESVLLASQGGTLGLFIAFLCLRLLRVLNPGNIPHLERIGIDPIALGFTAALCVMTGMLFGVIPAFQASKTDLNETLKEGGRALVSNSARSRLRDLLVVSEGALALMLLVGAGLMIRSFRCLEHAPMGFNPQGLVTMRITPNLPVRSVNEIPLFYEHVLDQIRTLPGVESAAIARDIPLLGANPSIPFSIAGRPVASPEKRPIGRYRAISPGYFHTMGIFILKGRDFNDNDNRGAPGVVIIDQTMANRFWSNRNPIGEQIKPATGTTGWCTIVGIVGSVRKGGPWFPAYPTMYYPYPQVSPKDIPLVEGSMRLIVRSPLPPAILRTGINREVAEVSKETPVYSFRTMDEVVSASMSRPRLNMVLLGTFGVLALLMAIVGLYAVISYSVTQRTHEIGIRMALGAQKSDVLKMVIGQGLKLVLIGVGIGVAGALALTRFLSSFLYGVKPTDPLTFIAVSLILIAVALGACYIPARRAAKVDPMVALRYE